MGSKTTNNAVVAPFYSILISLAACFPSFFDYSHLTILMNEEIIVHFFACMMTHTRNAQTALLYLFLWTKYSQCRIILFNLILFSSNSMIHLRNKCLIAKNTITRIEFLSNRDKKSVAGIV